MKSCITGLFLLILFCLHTPFLEACTTFCLESGDRLVFGRNYDWSIGEGLIVVNKRNMSKVALLQSLQRPMTWVSKYGSITFNQYGRELPAGGINEAGLVVEEMWLSGTRYPESDDRPGLRELAWIQYQLDTAATVDEVLASDAKIRIVQESVPLHFLVCDRSGRKAVIEFLNGSMVFHQKEELPYPALANSRYGESKDYIKRFQNFGGDQTMPASAGSLDRFSKAVRGVRNYDPDRSKGIITYAFDLLKEVSQGMSTRWSIVYDVKNLCVYLRTSEAPGIKNLALAEFDFSGETPVRVLDMNMQETGNMVPHFEDYTTEINKKLVFAAWKKTSFLKDTPELLLQAVAAYPESITFVKPEEKPAGSRVED